MDRDKANVMRLRVNRVNLVQRIEPNEIIPKLLKYKIITKDDVDKINMSRNKEDKARNIIDILITKDNKQKDWYNNFRNILQDLNYKDLVSFLDNTVIKQPNFVKKFINGQHNNNQSDQNLVIEYGIGRNNEINQQINKNINNKIIGNSKRDINERIQSITFDEETFTSIMVKGNYERTVSNLQTYSARPEAVIADLSKSSDYDDAKQAEHENIVYIYIRKLELLYSLYQNEQLLRNTFFLDTEVVSSILNSQYSHLYMKYFKNLHDTFGIDMLKFFKDSFIEEINNDFSNIKYYKDANDLMEKLCWLLIKNEKYEYAEDVLFEFLNYLNMKNDNSNSTDETILENTFNAQCLLLLIKTSVHDYKTAFSIFDSAAKLLSHLKEVYREKSYNCSLLYQGISQITLEEGSFDAALNWVNKSLMAADYKDELIVDILGHAVICYSSKWLLSKARSIALLGIQIARSKYGKNHPAFVKALLYYSYYSNEFLQDESGILLSRYTLDLARKIYGFDSLIIAEAYKSLSKALMAYKQFHGDLYLEYAHESYRIACVYFSTDSPKLISYQMTLASALQYKGVKSDDYKEKENYLKDALVLCEKAKTSCVNLFGEINCRTAKIYLLYGSIHLYMDRINEAEHFHTKSLEILKVLLPLNNFHVLLAKSTLGIFYKLIGNLNDATATLQDVVNNLKPQLDENIPWIPMVYENLIECYRLIECDDQADFYFNFYEKLKSILSSKTKFIDLNTEIQKDPPLDRSLNDYISEFLHLEDETQE